MVWLALLACVLLNCEEWSKYIVSASHDKTIRIWNLLYKRQENVLQGVDSVILILAVTSNNKYIISCYDNQAIRIWNFLKDKNG